MPNVEPIRDSRLLKTINTIATPMKGLEFYLSEKTAGLREARVMMFEVKGYSETAPPPTPEENRLILPYLPEDLKRIQRAKTSVRLTQKGAWVDKYGEALPQWHLSGTTGWRKRTYPELGRSLDGYEAWKGMEDFFSRYQKNTVGAAENGQEPPVMSFFHFYEEEFWVIEPLEINRFRNTRRPLLIGYELKFIGIHPSEKTPDMPQIPQFYSYYQPPDDLFLITLQKLLLLTLGLLSRSQLMMSLFGADAAALAIIGRIRLGIDIVLTGIDKMQFNGGTLDLSLDSFISLGQSLLSLSQIAGASIDLVAQIGSVISLISTLNMTALSLFQAPGLSTLFNGSFSSSISSGISSAAISASDTIFQPLGLGF